MKQADKGPTFLRHAGRVTHVVMTEELFDKLWPDSRRAWSVDEMPHRMKQFFLEALERAPAESEKSDD
ncbi:hypothetical protein SAMN04488030_0076 [Aliiroseovarius halocynthiae]|uniref:Uncharacterized protein n=1 Tax=Aliiroseovarius halocynthiae TaxID=985055 RepID=A0A545SNL3_9RHOB|nr:hypothetical protein [Aliiroseovarius halocynthiae]TQV66446.1 hypothetical protein FIL88_13910 [Aliiroseovarius halocynthiae]SMR83596.1 hypothetical protein SAMN04488030_0076 [Aliiroseovarius halocynthiae]